MNYWLLYCVAATCHRIGKIVIGIVLSCCRIVPIVHRIVLPCHRIVLSPNWSVDESTGTHFFRAGPGRAWYFWPVQGSNANSFFADAMSVLFSVDVCDWSVSNNSFCAWSKALAALWNKLIQLVCASLRWVALRYRLLEYGHDKYIMNIFYLLCLW